MSNKKARKPSIKATFKASSAAATERARKAVIEEIRGRLKGKPTKDAPSKQVRGAIAKRNGGLTAAFEVLRSAKDPMRCGDIVAESMKRGLWSTGGKTPSATIHAAIIRQIAAKGKDARFRKTGRGLFAANGKLA